LNASNRQPTKLTLAHHASGANFRRMSIGPRATFDMRKAGMSDSFRRVSGRPGVEFTNGKRRGVRLKG
jgi:hypothetical protein